MSKLFKNKENRYPQRISYKLLVTICISLLVGLFMVIMILNSFFMIRSNSLEMAEKEAKVTTDEIVSEIEDRLENLKQYYLYSAMDEDIEWFLNNKLDYSNYARYKQISSSIGNSSLFPNYINSYALINFNSGRVISSKGIYELKDMLNAGEIKDLYEDNSVRVNRGNWVYIFNGSSTDSLNAAYRLTADTRGLNFVLNLPIGVYTSRGFLQVNLNMQEWKHWIWNEADSSARFVVVLDKEGNEIYSTDSAFLEKCRNINKASEPYTATKEKVGGKDYIVSKSTSSILEWNYYVAYDYGPILGETSKLLIEFLIAIFVFAALSFITVRYALYHPVDRLMKEVTDSDTSDVKGNELQYLAGQFANLKNDKEALNLAMLQKREKLAELFEMRLIRSAVSAEDEWNDYIKDLNLTEHSFYAVIAIVLNIDLDEVSEEEINEDAICLALAENLPAELKEMTWLPLIYDSCTLTCMFASESEEELMEKISSFYEGMKQYAFSACGYNIQMGVSEMHTQHKHLGRAYHECIYALTMDVEEGENESEDAPDGSDSDCRFYIKPASITGDDINVKQYEKELTDALKSLDKGQCYRLLDEFTDNLKLMGGWTATSVYLSSIVDSILIQAMRMQVDIALICPEGMQKLHQSITEAGDLGRVRKNLKKMLIDPILQARFALLEDHSYQMMAEIEKKLSDSKGNITLNECADELNVTPTYIWKIMKAERGKTFSEYQEEYKIEEAKKLLQTSMSVSDIAAELGYTNAQNFIRFFSKGTGLTPGKYRKLMYGSV